MSLEMHIRKKLGNFQLDVELSHQQGVTAILGASGCGKSLTLQCIAGVVRPDEGFIRLNGRTLFDSERKIHLSPQKRHIGCLFQSYALFPTMTVERNIACGVPKGTTKNERRELVSRWIENMNLHGLEHLRPAQLSGGQQQRTALARVLIGRPEILMLDEPFSALDSHLRERLVTELRELLRTVDRDTLLVTHSRDEAYELSSTLAVMDAGRISRFGATKDVFADPKTCAAAILTGCKNVVPAKRESCCRVHVPSWGLSLQTEKDPEETLKAIGIRAHYFAPGIETNLFTVHISECVEEPFAWIVKFRFDGQCDSSDAVWWRIPKDRAAEPTWPAALGVLPSDILLLYE